MFVCVFVSRVSQGESFDIRLGCGDENAWC